MKTTLFLCRNQDLAWDPKKDIAFLCEQYGKEIQSIQSQLDQRQLHDAFFSSSYFRGLPIEGQRKCSIVLLGKEFIRSPAPAKPIPLPPSSTKGTPTGPNNAPSQGSRLPLQTYKSTPNLNTGPHPSAFQSPPLPGKNISSSQPSGPQPNGSSHIRDPTGPHAPVIPIYSTGQDPRPRNRPASNPSIPGHSRNPSPSGHVVSQTNASHPISVDSRHPNPSYAPPPVQTLSNTARPHVIPGHAPVAMTAAPVGSGPQKFTPSTIAVQQSNGILPNTAHNSYAQNHAGGSNIPPVAQAFTANTVPSAHRSRDRPPQAAPYKQNERDELNQPQPGGTPYTVRHTHQGHANFPPQPEHYQPASATNSSNAPRPRPADPSPPQSTGLRVVGPEGLYASPPKPIPGPGAPGPQASINSASARQRPASHSGLGQAGFAFELPATAPTPKPRSDSPHDLYNISPPTVQGSNHLPYRGGPVDISPPGQTSFAFELPAITTPAPSHPQPSELATPPSHSRAQSTPNTGLPASLMIGGPAHQRSHPKPHSESQLQPPPSNAQITPPTYQTYSVSPPKIYAAYSPPKPAAEPAYKAYSTLASPPIAPSTNIHELPSSKQDEVPLPTQQQLPPSNTPNSSTTVESTPAPKPIRKRTPPLPPLNTNLSARGKQPPQQQYPVNKRLSLQAGSTPNTSNASPSTATPTPSTSHITEELSKYYQRSEEVRYVNLPPMSASTSSDIAPSPLKPRRKSTFKASDDAYSQTPTQEKPLEKKLERKVTGYEAFVHGPYTPISAATEKAQQSVYDQCRNILEQAESREKSDLQRLERKYTVQEFEWEDSPIDQVRRQDSYYGVPDHYDGYRY